MNLCATYTRLKTKKGFTVHAYMPIFKRPPTEGGCAAIHIFNTLFDFFMACHGISPTGCRGVSLGAMGLLDYSYAVVS